MNFEHLIQITDPSNGLIPPMSRQQLWRGLCARAENPAQAVIGLEACEIVERKPLHWQRRLDFGTLVIEDTVVFEPLQSVSYYVSPTADFPASSLHMRIEEPCVGHLFIRFIYSSQHEPEEMLRAHLEEAYKQADLDTITMIRELHHAGELGQPEQEQYLPE